ncbi:MAG: NAD(P)-dependent oxidoreductase [Kiritimatiellales bacterium]|nr:NAD(P)-dependent oxidoreductase [Kiritimatiellales bacterium]
MRLLVTGASGFIGTNFVEHFSRLNCELLNMDIHSPLNPEHERFWKKVDIMNPAELGSVFSEFAPTHVVHMAARAECDENTTVEEGYAVNTIGTENVLNAIKNTGSVERAIIVSTQYVCGPGRLPEHDEDYFPHTVYGQSKVITEQLTRKADLPCVWTLIRPTNIWGPWHFRYQQEAWRVIKRGFYLHPAGDPVVRSYGYVGNIVWQMEQMLKAPVEKVDRQVFYVGDRPIDIYEWVDAFSMTLRTQHARKVPRLILRMIGLVGDMAGWVGVKFPLTSSRVRSMTQNYLTPMDKTFDALGEPPFSLKQGAQQTAEWLTCA